jgi:hypothetical protein
MFEKLNTLWNNCVSKGRNYITSYRDGDPLIIKKNVNISLSCFRKSAPDKNIFNISASGEPEVNLLDAVMFFTLLASVVSIICMISDAKK